MENRTRVLSVQVKLMKAVRSIDNAIDRWAAMPPGLSEPRFAVLETLFHKGSLCQRELGTKVLKSKGNISVMVDGLAKDGLIDRVRDSPDRRHVLVSLTDKGRAVFLEYFPHHVDALIRAFGTLETEEIDQLSQLLKKLGHGIDRELSRKD